MLLIFKSAVAFFFLFFLHGTSIGNGQQGISYNGARIADVKAFREQKARSDSTTSAFILAIRC